MSAIVPKLTAAQRAALDDINVGGGSFDFDTADWLHRHGYVCSTPVGRELTDAGRAALRGEP